ncbi:MAG: hypothetical protein WBA63_12010 [Thermomicrobiales bacterium]
MSSQPERRQHDARIFVVQDDGAMRELVATALRFTRASVGTAALAGAREADQEHDDVSR